MKSQKAKEMWIGSMAPLNVETGLKVMLWLVHTGAQSEWKSDYRENVRLFQTHTDTESNLSVVYDDARVRVARPAQTFSPGFKECTAAQRLNRVILSTTSGLLQL